MNTKKNITANITLIYIGADAVRRENLNKYCQMLFSVFSEVKLVCIRAICSWLQGFLNERGAGWIKSTAV